MIRDQLFANLGASTKGLPLDQLSSQFCSKDEYSLSAIEALLLLSPEVGSDGANWILRKKGRTSSILSAIEAYADSTGKKIFRASAALANLPPEEQPTEDELISALTASHGSFELLPNLMIKRRA